jgi:hypothetical protein
LPWNRARRISERAAECQVDPHAPNLRMLAILQHCNAVVAEPRRPAPDRNVTVTQRVFLYRIGALQSAELEGRGQAERSGNDWIGVSGQGMPDSGSF